MEIKGILISTLAPMNDHIANAGDKILKNASSIKQRPDGRVYISGQKQRHALFSAIERLNDSEKARLKQDNNQYHETYVSNGDGVTIQIENDLRADLGGFLQTKKGTYSGRRTAPVTATPAVAKEPSEIGRDLLIRLTQNPKVISEEDYDELEESEKAKYSKKPQAIVHREYSQSDLMLMNFFIDVSAVSIRKRHQYTNGMHVKTEYFKHVTEAERKRRIHLTIEATASLTDYANQARNATSGEPQQVLIVFDTKLSRKACRYFNALENERRNILRELQSRNAVYFFGDDVNGGQLDKDGNPLEPYSVVDAYTKAIAFLNDKTNQLFNLTGKDEPITTQQFEEMQ